MPTSDCIWHQGEAAIRLDEAPSCQACGRLYDTLICDACGLEYLNWAGSSWDDVSAPPAVNCSGDVMCLRCTLFYAEMDDDGQL